MLISSSTNLQKAPTNATQFFNTADLKVPEVNFKIIKQNKFCQSSKVDRPNMTEVLNGHYVPTSLYNDLKAHMAIQMLGIQEGKLYTLKEMCGESFWGDLKSRWFKSQAGRAFAHMVKTETLPFKFIQYKRSATKHYLKK